LRLLGLLLTVATYAVVRAIEAGKTKWLVPAATLVALQITVAGTGWVVAGAVALRDECPARCAAWPTPALLPTRACTVGPIALLDQPAPALSFWDECTGASHLGDRRPGNPSPSSAGFATSSGSAGVRAACQAAELRVQATGACVSRARTADLDAGRDSGLDAQRRARPRGVG